MFLDLGYSNLGNQNFYDITMLEDLQYPTTTHTHANACHDTQCFQAISNLGHSSPIAAPLLLWPEH